MTQLDTLRAKGWSYHVGYNQGYRSFYARAWKDREKPIKVPAPGGGDVHLFTFCVSAVGESIEAAALACFARVGTECIEGRSWDGGKWWDGLPVTKVRCRVRD